MAKLNPYLNFDGTCEEAFNFYKSVFGGEFKGGIFRMGDIEGAEIPEGERDLVMHVSLPIGNDILMGSAVAPSTVVAPHAHVLPPLMVAIVRVPPLALPVVMVATVEPEG